MTLPAALLHQGLSWTAVQVVAPICRTGLAITDAIPVGSSTNVGGGPNAAATESALAAIRQHAARLQAALEGAGVGAALLGESSFLPQQAFQVATAQRLCAASLRLAAALLDYWQQPEQAAAWQLEAAQAAAARSCAHLRCANLGGQGGPVAGQGEGGARCRWAVCLSGLCLLPHADAHACWQTCNCCTPCRPLALLNSCCPLPSFPPAQRLPCRVVVRHRLLPRRLAAGRAPPGVQGAGRGTASRQAAAAAAGGAGG